MREEMKMTHASVFSGIGGPEIAATMLGWDNAFHCEINEFGRKILEYWYPNSKSYEDITKTDFSEWRGRVDVLTGGFPCQPFSYAGQRRGADDDRYLWPHMFRCIDQVRPTWVVAENVAGILTMVEQGEVSPMESQGTLFDEGDGVRRHRLVETFTLQRICDDLEGHGYEVQPVLVPACAVGAPHRRDRVFIVARRVVADSDLGADGRAAREDAGESGAERIQERHEVREPDEPNQVRREGGLDAENAVCDGLQRGHSEEQGCERDERNAGAGDGERLCDEGSGIGNTDASADTPCGGEGAPGEGGSVEGDGRDQDKQPCQRRAASEWNSRFYELLRDAADTEEQCGERLRPQQSENCREEQEQFGGECGENGCQRTAADSDNGRVSGQRTNRELGGSRNPREPFAEDGEGSCGHGRFPDGRWQSFPTVSPVHRGNDGLPFDVDYLTIPFNKWRTESLKAYGNAIVPQVMYEIFRAIEIVEQENL